jgi:hypothetical protein
MGKSKHAVHGPMILAALAVSTGIALAPAQATAWADTSASGSTSSATSGADRSAPNRKAPSAGPKKLVKPTAVLKRSAASDTAKLLLPNKSTDKVAEAGIIETVSAPQSISQRASTSRTLTLVTAPTKAAAAAANPSPAVQPVNPTSPAPLSPIAQLLAIPGEVVNTVMQLLDITTSADGPKSPVDLAPLNDLFFAAFRELEHLAGLDQTPPVQPTVPTLTYTGSITRPTPTVTEFLNAAAAGYVLGATPADLKPFTVNGFQMSATNTLTGMAGDVWVTPEGQLIIAYEGTSGGTHLVFNPVIAITQLLSDVQMALTDTTPQSFDDAVDFANRVQAEAALQGYGSDDIFVTGHSLGGWQAEYVAQQTGLAGIGFEAPGINTTVAGNGADSLFVNIGSYGSPAQYMSTDLPGLQPFMPPYVAGGGAKPHYGSIIMLGDPDAMTPLYNASAQWGQSLIGSAVFLADFLGNLGQFHMVGVQAHNLDVDVDPGVVPWLGLRQGAVHTGYGDLTIPELLKAASDDGILLTP